MAQSKHAEFTNRIRLLQVQGADNIIAKLAEDPLTELRREIEVPFKKRQTLGDFLGKLEALLPHYYEDKELERQQELFRVDRLKMEHALVHGDSKGAVVDQGR